MSEVRKEKVSFGRVSFTYEDKLVQNVDKYMEFDIYIKCTLDNGTVIPQISVGYDYENHKEKNHDPTITVYYENEDGSIYVHS